MKKIIIFLLIFVVLLSFYVNADTERSVKYTPNSKITTYWQGRGNAIISAGQVYADSQGTLLQNAKSLLNTEFPIPLVIDLDKEYPLEIIDYNYTSITVKLEVAEKNAGKSIPITVYSKNDKEDKQYSNTVTSLSSGKQSEIILPFGMDKELKWGDNSTTVTLNQSSGFAPTRSPYNASSDFYKVREATTGEGAYTGGANTTAILTGVSGSEYSIARHFTSFNTSSIPDNMLVTSASFNIFVGSVGDEADSYSYYYIIADTTPSNYLSITEEDYDQCGDLDNPQNISGKIDAGSIVDDTRNVINIQPTFINKSGNTHFGMREGHDIESDVPTSNTYIYYYSHLANSDKWAYLNVTYESVYIVNITNATTSSKMLVTNGSNQTFTFLVLEGVSSPFLNITSGVNVTASYENTTAMTITSSYCGGTLNCGIYTTQSKCNNCSQCSWNSYIDSRNTSFQNITGSVDAGNGGYTAFTNRIFYDHINDRFHLIYIDGVSDLADYSTTSVNESWHNGGTVNAGTWDYDDFDCVTGQTNGQMKLHCAISPAETDVLSYINCNLTGTAPYFQCQALQTIEDSADNNDDINYPAIDIDKDGCLWVVAAFEDDSVTPDTQEHSVRIYRENSTTCGDGTWDTHAGYPMSAQTYVGYNVNPCVGIVSHGNGNMQVNYINPNASSSVPVYLKFWNATTNTGGTEVNINADIEYQTTAMQFETVSLLNGTTIFFGLDDATSDLDAYTFDSELDTISSKADTGLNTMGTMSNYPKTITAVLDSRNINRTIYLFSVNATNRVQIWMTYSTDSGTTWNPTALFNELPITPRNTGMYLTSVFNNETCDILVAWLGTNVTSFDQQSRVYNTGSCGQVNTTGSYCNSIGSCNSCPVGECNTNCSAGGCNIFTSKWVEGIGWQFNATIPNLADALYDLNITITYDGNVYSGKQTMALNHTTYTPPVIPDNAIPYWSLNQTTSTGKLGETVNFSIFWQDNINLSACVVYLDNSTGIAQHYVTTALTGNSTWCNFTASMPIRTGLPVQWWVRGNDTSNNYNDTPQFSFYLYNSSITYHSNSTSGITNNTAITHYLNFTSNYSTMNSFKAIYCNGTWEDYTANYCGTPVTQAKIVYQYNITPVNTTNNLPISCVNRSTVQIRYDLDGSQFLLTGTGYINLSCWDGSTWTQVHSNLVSTTEPMTQISEDAIFWNNSGTEIMQDAEDAWNSDQMALYSAFVDESWEGGSAVDALHWIEINYTRPDYNLQERDWVEFSPQNQNSKANFTATMSGNKVAWCIKANETYGNYNYTNCNTGNLFVYTLSPGVTDSCTPTVGQHWLITDICIKSSYSFTNLNYDLIIGTNGRLILKDNSNITFRRINVTAAYKAGTTSGVALNISKGSTLNVSRAT
jgi:hypothetical protein